MYAAKLPWPAARRGYGTCGVLMVAAGWLRGVWWVVDGVWHGVVWCGCVVFQERDVRRVPQHFWQAATSSRRLPPTLEGVANGGAIPNLAAHRAPLPPLKRSRQRVAAGRPRADAEPVSSGGDGGDGVGASGGSSADQAAQPRQRRRVEGGAPAVERQQRGGERRRAAAAGGGAGEAVAAVGGAAGGAVAGVGERGAAMRARQRLGQLADQESDPEVSDGAQDSR